MTWVPLRGQGIMIFQKIASYFLIIGKSGDAYGTVELSIPYRKKEIRLEVYFMGYQPIQLNINEAGKYIINCELDNSFPHIIPAQKKIFHFMKNSKDRFTLRKFENEFWKHTFTRHKKK